MNLSLKGFGSINQVLAETEMKSATWLHQSAISSKGSGNVTESVQQTQVICPEPRRASRIPSMLDGVNRFTYNQKSVDMIYADASDLINLLLGKDDMEGDSHSQQAAGYFRGTPPERTDNPLIHDAAFIRQNFSPASPFGVGNTRLGLASSPFDWDGGPSSSCGSSSFSPNMRIERVPPI